VIDASFLMIRHGESTWNAADRWQGQGDPPLSPRGRAQVARLCDELASAGIDAIVASDLARARQTAATLGDALGLPVASETRLRELDVGSWTGCTRDEIVARDGEALARFESGAVDVRAGGGETREELRRRALAALRDCADRHVGGRVAIVAHLGVVRALLPGTDLANAGWCAATGADIAARGAAEEAP
jgi:broad specificity phosphatase PhoE